MPERLIVLVDDMKPMLEIASDLLQRRMDHVRVLTFEKPTEALAYLQQEPRPTVDLILSDNHMGEMDGVTFLDKSRASHPETLRMLMTAYLDIVATPQQLGARGVHALIRKPWEWSDFIRAIFEVLAMTPEDRAHAAREGPIAFPEGAFAEFAASRRSPLARTPATERADAPAEQRVIATPSGEPTVTPYKPSAAVARAAAAPPDPAPAAPTSLAPTSADFGGTPARGSPKPPPQTRVIASPGHNMVACPHCMGVVEIEVQLPRLLPGATEEDEAKRLMAYLQAHPGVAARMRDIAAGGAKRRRS